MRRRWTDPTMHPDAFAILLPIVRDLGDHDAADLAALAGLPAADVSRRWLPWLRGQGLVEPAAYRLAPWAREGMASQTGADILAALECGPLTRDRLVVECSRVREERAEGPATLRGAWRRELWTRWEREQRAKAAALVERLGGVRC